MRRSGSLPAEEARQAQFRKMTETPIPRLISSLAVPTVITMMVSNIYNLVDTAFVGTLGTSASGAVGIVFGFMAILQAIGFMFGQGAGSILSRKLGARDIDGASVTTSTGFFWSFCLGTVTAIICYLVIDPLIRFLGSTETIAPYAKTYIGYILITAPFAVSGFTLNNMLRYEGKAVFGMIGLMTGAVLNIGGDALLIFHFHMGIAGAGLSTAISQVVSFFVLLSAYLTGKTQSRLRFRMVSLHPAFVWDIAATGLPSLLRQGLNSISTILLNSCAAVYGDACVAGMSIVSRIFFFIFAVAIGVGQGFQPVSAFNYGAGKFSRVRQGMIFTCSASEVLMVILGTGVFLGAPTLVRLMRDDPEVITIATRALRLQCVSVIALPPCMTAEMAMQSTGHKFSASILSMVRSGLLFVPCLLVLSALRGLSGIQEAQPLAFFLSVPVSIVFLVWFYRSMPDADTVDAEGAGG